MLMFIFIFNVSHEHLPHFITFVSLSFCHFLVCLQREWNMGNIIIWKYFSFISEFTGFVTNLIFKLFYTVHSITQSSVVYFGVGGNCHSLHGMQKLYMVRITLKYCNTVWFRINSIEQKQFYKCMIVWWYKNRAYMQNIIS